VDVLHKISSEMKKVVLLIVAVLLVSLTFSQTKTEIKPADLSKNISAYIAKNFSGYGVDRAFKVVNKGVMSTEVTISKGTEQLALTFDKDFKLTKKEAIKPDLKTPPAKEDKKPSAPVKK
jgi:hypothetical protein